MMPRLSCSTALLLLLLLGGAVAAPASESSCSKPVEEVGSSCCARGSIELKTGYFLFANSKMRQIYDQGGLDLQLSATYLLKALGSQWTLNGYGAVEYFHRSGRSIHGEQRTSLWAAPIHLGLQSMYAIQTYWKYSLAVGPSCVYLRQHNRSSNLYRNGSRYVLGFFINSGFDYLLCDHISIAVFGEYLYARARLHSGRSEIYTRTTQIGGFSFGGGLRYEF